MGRLVQLEVTNFKSYRGHHVIGPFKDFTAVIGPNGSGKSNLMDAISFVLGVQSAHLRSTNLKELIYRGRALVDEQGTPVATGETESATSASVSAVYEDDQGRRTVFTRTIAADGSSDYRINSRPSKREPYISLLERENILVKARNFLVFQGDVEAVASQNPKDLTRLIEQVSGSLELKPQYDTLKDAMDKQLESSASMYQKRKTVQAELKQYREQKDEADKFDALEVERGQLILDHTLWRLFHVERDLERVQESTNNAQGTRAELAELEAAADRKLAAAKQAVAAATRDVTRAERKVAAKDKEIADRAPQVAQLQQSRTHAEGRRDRLSATRNKVAADVEKHAEGVEHLEKQIKALDQAKRKVETKIANAKRQREALEAFTDEYHRMQSEYLVTAAPVQQELDSARLGTKTRGDRIKAAESKRDAAERSRVQVQTELDAAKSKLSNARDNLELMHAKLADIDTEIAQSASRAAALRAREVQLNESFADVSSKLMEYTADRRATQRERAHAELVAELKAMFPNTVHGTLAQVCKPAQKKYEVAVGNVLGRHLDAIVTDNQATAIECIRYMRENRKGHAQFLPLAELVTKEIPQALRMFAHARPARDLIEYSKDVAPAVEYACGTALVAESMDVARHICYERDTRVKCVTLDGITIQKGGGMSGSSDGGRAQQQQRASRWDEQEMDDLQTRLNNIRAQLLEVNAEKRKAADRERPEERRVTIAGQVEYLTNLANGLQAKVEALETQVAALEKERVTAERTIDELQEEMGDAHVEDLEARLDEIKQATFADFCARVGVGAVDEFERIVIESAAAEARELQDVEKQRANVESTLVFEREQLAQMQTRLQSLEDDVAKQEKAIVEAEHKMEQVQEVIAGIQAEMDEMRQELDGHKKVRDEKAAAHGLAKRQLAEVRKELEAMDRALAEHFDSRVQLHHQRVTMLRRARVEGIPIRLTAGSMASLAPDVSLAESQEVSQGIEIDYSGLDPELQADGSDHMEQQFNARLNEIAADLDRMAPNRRALDKMSGVTTKAKQTEKEFDAVRRAAKHAKDAFESVRAERYTRFMDAFQHISGCIDKVYKDLTMSRNFPLGGTAYLSLESEEDPFSSGIKYHAMPPMKRFRDMEQLSGGEKTVAALALLFAINSYRPSPFFVLDEVDAALDNANVAKVARYVVQAGLGKQGGKDGETEAAMDRVQFVVISLKNSFYERAQALVGVHRDNDQNTSSVLTLDLEQFPAA
ncbi:cohesin complex subunit psm1 [Catenaria anguillulae PL171]|uniref:Structural maintenance of chromosomes protein n=1 Tax=Catenaria anguillulae PL171 TaxID=765915 RepID=A0A1Y2H944_9FUNG|nr:cohesin complex subunit psm1 [Catenaria anguillulae PL171]